MMTVHETTARRLRRSVITVLVVAMIGAVLPSGQAFADGRVHNPKRLRTKKEPVSPGRTIKQPKAQIPDARPLMRSTAMIPNPEPRSHGGSGYERNGKYFYEQPKPIALRPPSVGNRYRETIPNPTHQAGGFSRK